MNPALPVEVPQYFFDDGLVDQVERLERRWLPASVYPEPVLKPDRPWEGRSLVLYGSVLPDPTGGYRMYYSNFRPGIGPSLMMLATSQDGFVWEKPDLGLIAHAGSRANNILVSPQLSMDSPSVIWDRDDPAFPYKMVCFHSSSSPAWNENWGMYAYRSADGLRWEAIPGRRVRLGDRNSLFRDSGSRRYVIFTRDPDKFAEAGGRHISRSESADFFEWSTPELIFARDRERETDVEYYGMPVFERHGWYFGLLEYWNRVHDRIQVHLVISRDGKQWSRPRPDEPFIAAIYDWNRAWSTCANNGPVIMREQMVFYFGGRWVAHTWDTARHHGVIGFASLPLDRFSALEGDGSGGNCTTRPVTWPGGDLVLNADTRQSFESHPAHCNGELGVEVLDAEAQPLPAWSGAQRAVFHGNTHCRGGIHDGTVRWPGDRGLDALRGQTFRLRFHLKHARLFTIEARSQ